MAEDKPRDMWERLEIFSKIVGGVSIPIFGLVVTIMLHYQAQSAQKSQLYANIVAGREKADSEVRAEMFKSLLDRYLSPPERQQGILESYRRRVVFLDLLRANFDEYFNAKALFTQLYEEIREREAGAIGKARQDWSALKRQLIEIAKDTTSHQIALLVRGGHLVDDILIPLDRPVTIGATGGSTTSEAAVSKRIPLYATEGLTGLEGLFYLSREGAAGSPAAKQSDSRYSITIRVREIQDSSARVSVLLYRDVYKQDKSLDVARSGSDLRTIDFEISYFSTPYMDNTRLFGGSRFSVIYVGCVDTDAPDQECQFPLKDTARPMAQFRVVTFEEAFLSQRDRPYVNKILEQVGSTKGWW